MEQFERLVTAPPCVANQVRAGIEELERGAFERGLPEKATALFGSGNHVELNHTPHNQMISVKGESIGAPPLILLIDDEEPFRSVLKQVLQNAGYEVVEAANRG